MCRNRCKREIPQQQQCPPNRSYLVSMLPSSSKMTASSSVYTPNGMTSLTRTARLSHKLPELDPHSAGNSLATLKQSFAHIRNSIELTMNARQKKKHSIKETTTKQCAPLSSSNNVVHVRRLTSVMRNKHQLYSDDNRKMIPGHDYSTNPIDASFEDEEDDTDDNDKVRVLPNEEQENGRFKPFNKHYASSVTVTKGSRRKKSTVPTVFC